MVQDNESAAYGTPITKSSSNADVHNSLAIDLRTNTDTYYVGENVGLSGKVFNSTDGSDVKSTVTLTILNSTAIYSKTTFPTAANGSFQYAGFRLTTQGVLNLTATAEANGQTSTSFKIIHIRPPFNFESLLAHTWFWLPLAFAIISGIITSIMSVCGGCDYFNIQKSKGRAYLLFQFTFITSLTAMPLVILLFNDSPIGTGPISIVRHINANGITWFIDFGGIEIPFLVLVLSLLGANIRYLWDVYRFLGYDETQRKANLKVSDLYGLLWRGVTMFFLAPLLAYALYFALSLSGTDSLLAFAFSSIVIGLVAENIVGYLQDRARGALPATTTTTTPAATTTTTATT